MTWLVTVIYLQPLIRLGSLDPKPWDDGCRRRSFCLTIIIQKAPLTASNIIDRLSRKVSTYRPGALLRFGD